MNAMRHAALALGSVLIIACPSPAHCADPLPSWTAGKAKQTILAFVAKITQPGSATFVAPAERIATFDNDGTLWAEQPVYVQLLFARDRIKALAPHHPEWRHQEPFASLLKGDWQAALAGGDKALLQLIMATHVGMTTEEFDAVVKQWLASARHPVTQRPYTQMVYQPMLELLAYLRANGFKTFLVSGGGVEFMRTWSEQVYGIPAEQVIGSSIKTRYELRNGQPVLVRVAELQHVNDEAGKPMAIHHHIGRRPIAAFGNSDGDLPMLQWTMAGPGPRFALLVHHNDGEREWAYDRQSKIGRLDKALDIARSQGWTVVDIKRDWQVIYPVEQR